MKEDIMEVDRAKESYTCVNISTLEKLGKRIELLQEQIYEANGIIGELYHICQDKKKASSIVCDYLVKYGKTLEVESEV